MPLFTFLARLPCEFTQMLPVGRWKLSATHGQETARETVEGEAWETVEVDLMLGGISVEGEVWLGDERAAGGTLILTTEGAQAPGVVVMMQRVTADRQFFGIDQQPLQFMVSGDGRFAGSGLSPGRYYASYTPAGGASAAITKILDVPHVESFQCAIQYSDAVVEGFVIDTDGQPKHHWLEEGREAKRTGKTFIPHVAVGMVGFEAGPEAYILDVYAITDPLLARLPMNEHLNYRQLESSATRGNSIRF